MSHFCATGLFSMPRPGPARFCAMNPDMVAAMKSASTTAGSSRGDNAARRYRRGRPTAALAVLTLQVGAFAALTSGFSVEAVRAETISSALSRAYMGNPDLNQQ